jgi:hypothetical protein
MKTPVALFVFNRPDLTRQVFARIAEARPERLLVVADGPRPGEELLCAEVRAIVTNPSWPCEIETNFSERNLGCGRRIASGLDWVFSRHESTIVLEDDCLPSPSFFPFCEELLERYRDDDRVGVINGFNLGHRYDTTTTDYVFSRYMSPWGWASWSRVWRDYNFTIDSFDPAALDELFDDPLVAAHFKERIDRSRRGEIDTWDYQFAYSILVQSRLAVVPAVNLIRNIGLGRADASHTSYEHPFANVTLGELTFPLRHPRLMIPSREANGMIETLARQLQAAAAQS